MAAKARTGFSLIELLVVIAVVALLMGILLPALSRARHAAWRTVSASNLRSALTLAALYQFDHDDNYPNVHLIEEKEWRPFGSWDHWHYPLGPWNPARHGSHGYSYMHSSWSMGRYGTTDFENLHDHEFFFHPGDRNGPVTTDHWYPDQVERGQTRWKDSQKWAWTSYMYSPAFFFRPDAYMPGGARFAPPRAGAMPPLIPYRQINTEGGGSGDPLIDGAARVRADIVRYTSAKAVYFERADFTRRSDLGQPASTFDVDASPNSALAFADHSVAGFNTTDVWNTAVAAAEEGDIDLMPLHSYTWVFGGPGIRDEFYDPATGQLRVHRLFYGSTYRGAAGRDVPR